MTTQIIRCLDFEHAKQKASEMGIYKFPYLCSIEAIKSFRRDYEGPLFVDFSVPENILHAHFTGVSE